MCQLCIAHERKLFQLRAAIDRSQDLISANLLQRLVTDAQRHKPECTDTLVSGANAEIDNVVHFHLQRIDNALSTLSISDIEELVRAIEAKISQHDGE